MITKINSWIEQELLRHVFYFIIFFLFFEAEGFGIPCTAWAGSGLLVKSRLIRIRADEGARERTRTLKIELVLAAAGVTFP